MKKEDEDEKKITSKKRGENEESRVVRDWKKLRKGMTEILW